MITVYRDKTDIPSSTELVEFNDLFFNQNIMERLDLTAQEIIKNVDGAALRDDYRIQSGINGDLLNLDKLSTGCKTALNIYYFPEKVFSLKECGDNALDLVYSFASGQVFSEYPIISLFLEKVRVCDKTGEKVLDHYEDLKDWWQNVQ